MNIALINPRWSFDGSIYFGCREPHLPVEFGYARTLLERDGHNVVLLDAQLHDLDLTAIAQRLDAFGPDLLVVTTAPSYLFWRCAPPELRVPRELLVAVEHLPAVKVVVGPHASTTPQTTVRKLGADVAVLGECEEVLAALARSSFPWADVQSIAVRDGDRVTVQGSPAAANLSALPALSWGSEDIRRHRHHHHRFDAQPEAPGAEMEVSRGCPYHCTFCAKDNFRDDYRKRPLPVILEELEGLQRAGVEYVYFIDEIFLPDRALLDALIPLGIKFGVQTRIDLWNAPMLERLGAAGCVSIEAGVESISIEGRNLLAKGSRLSTEQITERLINARQHVPFVQANLIECGTDDPAAVERWRQSLIDRGIWANTPVPMFPYPGSPGYTLRWGASDDDAWERASAAYLDEYRAFSDIQDAHPRPLADLEGNCVGRPADKAAPRIRS